MALNTRTVKAMDNITKMQLDSISPRSMNNGYELSFNIWHHFIHET